MSRKLECLPPSSFQTFPQTSECILKKSLKLYLWEYIIHATYFTPQPTARKQAIASASEGEINRWRKQLHQSIISRYADYNEQYRWVLVCYEIILLSKVDMNTVARLTNSQKPQITSISRSVKAAWPTHFDLLQHRDCSPICVTWARFSLSAASGPGRSRDRLAGRLSEDKQQMGCCYSSRIPLDILHM